MSRQSREEHAALLAFVNSFKLSRPVRTFDALSDGKALMEVMAMIDPSHFKNAAGRQSLGSSPASRSSENWVLKMNTLKRLHRLLVSYPLPSPHPPNLGTSSLPEPNFSAIARSPTTVEGAMNLVQLCRLCLAAGVLGPGNEKVIAKIQSFEEGTMASLMKSIEEVMRTLPQDGEQGDGEIMGRSGSPPSCEQMMEQVAEMSSVLEEAKVERDEAMASLAASRDTGNPRHSLPMSSESERLRAELTKTEEALQQTEVELERHTGLVADLTKTVEELTAAAAETSKLKDQLDEYRHTAERLQKSENVIEKYKKKLEESAGLRRELRSLEEENAQLVNTNTKLEADIKSVGASKSLLDEYRSQVDILERRTAEQANEIVELQHQIEDAHLQLATLEQEAEKDREELHLHQERAKEADLSGDRSVSMARDTSGGSSDDKPTLDDELVAMADDKATAETRTSLKLRVKALERQLAQMKGVASGDNRLSALQTLLEDANRSRDRYQLDYLEAHRTNLRLETTLQKIRSGSDNSQASVALKARVEELEAELDALRNEAQVAEREKDKVQLELSVAREDLELVDKDQLAMLSTLRDRAKAEYERTDVRLEDLKQQVEHLRQKDRVHLEEIKKLLMDKVDMQSASITQREKDLSREKEFGDLKAALAAKGLPIETQNQIMELHGRNSSLQTEITSLNEQIRDLRLSKGNRLDASAFEEAQKAYEQQISTLKSDLLQARASMSELEQRYGTEQRLMLSAWHDLGQRVMRDHLAVAGTGKRHQRPATSSWLGRQRRYVS
ncbi:hypothetical protein TREMEDRAFT_64529 [Tremella mesenterica DSM 1558]|uniref:uncharacterized protein n=1 Tax=Tremella mesenterica (strain ATCC 24925 / CBS 8224 / DSM 1558 / NBRC 9311 / NRRL Y-6157 / RJB 2259-6 / UBC 559-6) TaxID=578456 RepID=UPI0003F49F90|nr:uncharacterized protein TREMEDRAFT_64529 [Tremella mesenterica DSM 1558]EIW67281.1 hypothetical protein TREMEDRAFT_64529 [Tremella mesenterica DSM 1558]